MLLTLIACGLSVFVAANPFHKYPYVFLLDVGNEELQKTNSEQIRLSVPGGSVALRYPAVGTGDTIGHVRVSGIDFGTDLKVNIVDGGPGSKYVVLVFMGNLGVAYDAVITIQTVEDLTDISNNDVSNEDSNNSAEDLSDDTQEPQTTSYIEKTNSEIMQSSSNVYQYARNEEASDDYENSEDLDEANQKDEENQGDEEEELDDSQNNGEAYQKDIHVSYYDDGIGAPVEESEDSGNDEVNSEELNPNEDIDSPYDYPEDQNSVSVLNDNQYSKYKALEPHLNYGGQVYSVDELQKSDTPVYQEDPLDYEEPSEGRFRTRDDDDNNNYIDSDDSYAVAY